MRKIIETELIKEHHWLPQDIAKIPYKDLQMYSIIRRQVEEAGHQRPQVEAIKAQNQAMTKSSSSGQQKRFTKITKLTP